MSGIASTVSGGIKSIQRGTISVSAGAGTGTATATITAVDTAKSECRFMGATSAASIQGLARVTLTNSTTVTADASGDGSTYVVGYEVVERY